MNRLVFVEKSYDQILHTENMKIVTIFAASIQSVIGSFLGFNLNKMWRSNSYKTNSTDEPFTMNPIV